MTRHGQELVGRQHATAPQGRRLNNRARADVHRALDRLTTGDWRGKLGSHGRTYHDQLAYQILEDPLGALQWINDHTPCDEGSQPATNPLILNNIGALYLTAMQRANEQHDSAKTIEVDQKRDTDATW